MYDLSIEIESRRQIKILIKKFSFELMNRLIETENLNIIPKKFSWILLNKEITNQYKFKTENIKKILGLILWNTDFYRNYEIIRKPNLSKNSSSYREYPLFSKSFSYGSNYILSGIKLIDSYFQIKRKFLGTLPVICSAKNLYGILISLRELLDILFRELIQTNIVHKIAFVIIKALIHNFLQTKKFYIKDNLIRYMFIEIILGAKSE